MQQRLQALLRKHPSPVEVPDVLLRNHCTFRLQHLGSQLCQVVALTANQLLGRDLYVTHQTATGGALLCKATTPLKRQNRKSISNIITNKNQYTLKTFFKVLTFLQGAEEET